MKYRYNKESDVLVIELKRQKPDFAEQVGNIITHYDKKNKPVEIEILDAAQTAQDIINVIRGKKASAQA